ncbi:hypothetical protein B0H66DRAFT_537505 [Apodospora peruviana]|uniref:Uncharacterized protein n=1 Tax=Apodospora peruviana TaxID=516989 RepID=A0AAE0HXA4_9PEZI|nr:hypothetical protein B0H66DRAFT_537505 [Apodospora peruviana]
MRAGGEDQVIQNPPDGDDHQHHLPQSNPTGVGAGVDTAEDPGRNSSARGFRRSHFVNPEAFVFCNPPDQSQKWVGRGSGLPPNFFKTCQTIFRQMFRVYAHLYWSHFKNRFKLDLEKLSHHLDGDYSESVEEGGPGADGQPLNNLRAALAMAGEDVIDPGHEFGAGREEHELTDGSGYGTLPSTKYLYTVLAASADPGKIHPASPMSSVSDNLPWVILTNTACFCGGGGHDSQELGYVNSNIK